MPNPSLTVPATIARPSAGTVPLPVTGANFSVGESLQLRLDGKPGPSPQAGADGAFSGGGGSIDAMAAAGNHLLEAIAGNGTAIRASATFSVTVSGTLAVVTTKAQLQTALGNAALDGITIAAGSTITGNLDCSVAARTAAKPLTITAEAGVTFNGNGTANPILDWQKGGSYQTWDLGGALIRNAAIRDNGAIRFGNATASFPAPHHITLRNFRTDNTITGRSTQAWGQASASPSDYLIQFGCSQVDGPNNIEVTDFTATGAGGLEAAWAPANSGVAARNCAIRRATLTGFSQTLFFWDYGPGQVAEDVTIADSKRYAVRRAIDVQTTLTRVVSTNSGQGGARNDAGTAQLVMNGSSLDAVIPQPVSTNWNTAIAAAAPGATLNFTGTTFSGKLVLTKAVTLLGGTLTVPAGEHGIDVRSSGVTINGMTILGNETAFSGVWGTASPGLVVTGCTIKGFVYAGILCLGQAGGSFDHNLIQRIGVTQPKKPDYNGYGIAVTMNSGGTVSSDVLVAFNTVEDVPYWHAFDTHGGLRITFEDNISKRCPRAFFITANQANERAVSCIVRRNHALEAGATKPGGTNPVAYSLYDTRTCTITDNHTATSYPSFQPAGYYDISGLSTGVTANGNTRP